MPNTILLGLVVAAFLTLVLGVRFVAAAPTAEAKLREFVRVVARWGVLFAAQAVVTMWAVNAPPAGAELHRMVALLLGCAMLQIAALVGLAVPVLRALADLASALRLDLAVRQQTAPGGR